MIWPFRNWFKKPTPLHRWDARSPLFTWTKDEPCSLEDAFRGFQCWGMTGAGKSSGPGRVIAHSYLNADFAGLVLCAKPGEYAAWKRYAQDTQRSDDLIRFSPFTPFRYNVLASECAAAGADSGLTENLVQLFQTISEITSRSSSLGGGGDQAYWIGGRNQLLRNGIDLALLADGTVTVESLYQLILSAPRSLTESKSTDWQRQSVCFQALQRSEERVSRRRLHDFKLVADYFLNEFPGLSDKTRSIIVSMLTTLLDPLHRGILHDLFGTTSNITPQEILDEGRVIVIDLPVKEYAECGLYAAAIWKYMFQRTVERRRADPLGRPVFLFADESHLFTSRFDALFQSTARSSRCSTIYLTQNLNNYFAAYGGGGDAGRGRSDTLSLLGNLTSQIATCLGDMETAQYLSNLCGHERQLLMSGSQQEHYVQNPESDYFGRKLPPTSSFGYSEQWQPRVQPGEFFSLRPGGVDGWVQAIVWRGGRIFPSTGQNYLWTRFSQF